MQKTLLTENIYSRVLFYSALVLVFLVSAVVYSQYGFNGYLLRDDAMYLYSGQQMANGIPPYVSVFDHKGPITPMISGLGVLFSKIINTDDIYTVRAIFFVISVLAVGVLFVFSFQLFRSSYKTAFLTSFLFINFWGFGRHAASGPRGKTPMVLFEILALWLTSRKMWFLAGFCGSLSFLTWQPTIIFPFITILLSIVQSKEVKERKKNVIRAILGVLTPLLVVSLYFLLKGAFLEFIDGFLLFNLVFLDRPNDMALFANIKAIFREISKGYTIAFIPILLGLLAIVVIFIWRINIHQKKVSFLLTKDPFAGLLLSFPFPFIWSVFDFQGYADFFVFLPFTAIGFGWFLNQAIENLKNLDGIKKPTPEILFFITYGLLIITAIGNYRLTAIWASYKSKDLVHQISWTEEVTSRFGNEIKVVSIDIPQAIVLRHMTNPNPYIYIDVGIDKYIDAYTPGGFGGWIENIQRYDPDVIFYGRPRGELIPMLDSWLSNNYQKTKMGEWKIYYKSSIGK